MAPRRPPPLNQFYRLRYDSALGKYVKTTRWNCVVRDHNFDSENCMATMGALAAWAETNGSRIVTPCQIRQNGGDLSGGMGIDDVGVAWGKLGIGTLWQPDWFNWADIIRAVRDENRLAIVAGDHDQIDYADQCQKGGTFDHAFAIHDVRSDGQIVWTDPLCTAWKVGPQSDLRPAVEKIARAQRGTDQRLFVGFTRRRPEAISVRYKLRITRQLAFFSYDVSNGVIVDRDSQRLGGTAGDTEDVPCTAGVKTPWPAQGVSKVLHRVTKGVYDGLYVSAPQDAVKLVTVMT